MDGLEPRLVIVMIGNNNMFFTPETGIEAAAKALTATAAVSTVKVVTSACGYELTGTGFSIGLGYYLTNAHVVAAATAFDGLSATGG